MRVSLRGSSLIISFAFLLLLLAAAAADTLSVPIKGTGNTFLDARAAGKVPVASRLLGAAAVAGLGGSDEARSGLVVLSLFIVYHLFVSAQGVA